MRVPVVNDLSYQRRVALLLPDAMAQTRLLPHPAVPQLLRDGCGRGSCRHLRPPSTRCLDAVAGPRRRAHLSGTPASTRFEAAVSISPAGGTGRLRKVAQHLFVHDVPPVDEAALRSGCDLKRRLSCNADWPRGYERLFGDETWRPWTHPSDEDGERCTEYPSEHSGPRVDRNSCGSRPRYAVLQIL